MSDVIFAGTLLKINHPQFLFGISLMPNNLSFAFQNQISVFFRGILQPGKKILYIELFALGVAARLQWTEHGGKS